MVQLEVVFTSLHTISIDHGDRPVEKVKVKVNPLTNIVQANDENSDKDILSASEMDFNPNNV